MKKNRFRALICLCLALALIPLISLVGGDTAQAQDCALTSDSPYSYSPNTDGSGSGSASSYAISVTDPVGGTLTPSARHAKYNAQVTITAEAAENYVFNSLTVTTEKGRVLELTDLGEGRFTFKMPRSKVIVTGQFTWVAPFEDVAADDPNRDAIHFVYENNLMNGIGGGSFGSEKDFTRAQLVTVLWRLAGEPTPETLAPFTDTDPNGYYTAALAWCYETGLVNGYPDGRFGPSDPVTREQLAVFLSRFAAAQELDMTINADVLADCADADAIAPYALESVQWALTRGALKTTGGKLNPAVTAARGEVAFALYLLWG